MQGQNLRIQKSVIEGRRPLLRQRRDRPWLNLQEQGVAGLQDFAMSSDWLTY